MRLKYTIALGCFLFNIGILKADPKKADPSDTTKSKRPAHWFNLDYDTDHVRGTSAEKAYEFLKSKNKKSKTVIVAVIDSGVDYDHEDLKDVMWTNPGEIAGNGIDDDKNGYIDDIYGWNFIGGKNGNVNQETLELTREYKRLSKLYKDLKESDGLPKKKVAEYELYKKVKKDYEAKLAEAKSSHLIYSGILKEYTGASKALKAHLKTEKLTPSKVGAISGASDEVMKAKTTYENWAKRGLTDVKPLQEGVDHFKNSLDYGLSLEFDARKVVGDDYLDFKNRSYGNNEVKGPSGRHGTHVAGTIGAKRNNGIGMNGVADNVRIMAVRAVPDGDERDKDVANAIRYAVDNGAQIINMSFGKSYSPHKSYVDKAVKYAEKKGVLLLHAAGNSSKNLEENLNFPTKGYVKKKKCNTWLEIGASSWKDDNDHFVAGFTNYGQTKVDIFSPGVQLYATVPGSKYADMSGTSMATPAAAGVAAIVMSYYPKLSAKKVAKILMLSSVKYKDRSVNKPGTKDHIEFGKLSVSGGIINALEAVKMAEKMSK